MPVTRAFAERCFSAGVSGTGWVRQFLIAGLARPIPSNVYIKRENRTMAPDFTLNDSSGKPVRLSELRGNVVLLNFWATWCAPCQVEIPRFIGWQSKYAAGGLQIIGVSMDDDLAPVAALVRERAVNYPVVMGDEHIGLLYGGVLGLPVTYLIDRRGIVRARYQGAADLGAMESAIRKLLGRP